MTISTHDFYSRLVQHDQWLLAVCTALQGYPCIANLSMSFNGQ
ncbi:hypothetical protein DSUL_170043 [Desulfovibrionales bacterium]